MKSGLRILIQAPEVPFSAPPKCLKTPVLTILGVPKIALRVFKSKNARKQTGFKIKFCIGIHLTGIDFGCFGDLPAMSPSPTGERSV